MIQLRSLFLATLCVALPTVAQTLNLNFSELAAKATSKTELTLDGAMMQGVLGSMADKMPAGLKAVSVHAYEFAKAGDYPTSGLDALRKQVAGDSRWSRVLSAHEENEQVDIYVMNQDGKLAGFLLIAAEAKEVAVILGTGTLELAQLKEVVSSTIGFDLAQLTNAK